jgi:cholesterol oxidase
MERHQPGIRFTERMAGWWSTEPTIPDGEQLKRSDYEAAFERGRREGRALRLILTIEAEDLEATLRDPKHRFWFAGTATIKDRPGKPEREKADQGPYLARGVFKLFTADPNGITSKQMEYRAHLDGQQGDRWRLEGFKALRKGGGFAGFETGPRASGPMTTALGLWTDNTRLYFKLRRLTPPLRGLGVLTLSMSDFFRQLSTIRPTRTGDVVEGYDTVTRFLLFFGGVLRDTYGGPLARSRYAPPNWWKRPRRDLDDVSAPESIRLHTQDGVELGLTRYRPSKGVAGRAVILAPGFGVRADSFAIDTVRPNLVEYLGGKGYETWLFDYRASPALTASEGEFSLDHIAQHDWPMAVAKVYELTGRQPVNVIAHCVGAMSLMMAALGGSLERGQIRSAIFSQVGAHPIGAPLNELKAVARIGVLLELLGMKNLRVTVHAADTYRRPVLDRLLKYWPTPDPCDNPVCRRVRFVFGESYLHANLNRKTHDAIIEMFGDVSGGRPARASLRALRHLARVLRHGEVVHEDGAPYLTGPGKENLNGLGMRLCLMSGKLNHIFPPQGIERTQQLFKEWGVERLSEPIPLDSYAHMDCFIGAAAHQQVFPRLLAEIQAGDARPGSPGSGPARPGPGRAGQV